MNRPLELLKSALVTGLIIVLPAWLALLLLLQLLLKLGVLVKPIAAQMPDGINHPQLVAAAVFILICLMVGLLVHTAVGRVIGRTLGDNVFNRVPGYQPLRNIARQFSDMKANDGFKPALIEVEDGCLAPAFLIDAHPDGLSTVFMPSARVHPIDVPVTTMMKCISKWGSGFAELLAARKPPLAEIRP